MPGLGLGEATGSTSLSSRLSSLSIHHSNHSSNSHHVDRSSNMSSSKSNNAIVGSSTGSGFVSGGSGNTGTGSGAAATLDAIRNRMNSITKSTERVEAKYDVVMDFPNLELHSAAASGNVGLVHYALTHGQPVNSLLHGCLPLHAACSGGSVSVVRMLIERGADVNAPRLPRRYSDGKRSGVPSVGTVGSTPLHFAAANGHASIVQILLAGGAIPDKPDKNGMTPEDLAEMSGHSDVIRTLRVWEHLKRTDSQVSPSNSATTTEDGSMSQMDAGGSSGGAGPSRYSISSSAAAAGAGVGRSGSMRSNLSVGRGIKGKERAESFNSISSEVVELKGQLEQTLGLNGSETSTGLPSGTGSLRSGSSTPSKFGITSLYGDGRSTADLPLPFQNSAPNSPRDSTADDEALSRVNTSASAASSRTGSLNESLHAVPSPPLQSHSHLKTSRRPSLPSILEKAVHPGAAFRAAMRRGDRDRDRVRGDHDTVSAETSTKHTSTMFRGRNHHRASPAEAMPGSSHPATKKYSKQSLLHLFKRSGSPPSRSPSPPTRSETAGRIIGADELDEGIERLRRASIDLDLRERGEGAMSINSAESISSHGMIAGGAGNGAGGLLDVIEVDDGMSRGLTVSAPPTRTRFFEDVPTGPSPPNTTAGHTSDGFLQQQQQTVGSSGGDRSAMRPRTSSGVISPSPLAREWGRPKSDEESEEEDDDEGQNHYDINDHSPPQAELGVRRSKTDISAPPSSTRYNYIGLSQSSSPLAGGRYSPRRTPSAPSLPAPPMRIRKPRSATLPSSGMAPESDLRKVASTLLLRVKERRIAERQREDDEEEGEEEDDEETENEHGEIKRNRMICDMDCVHDDEVSKDVAHGEDFKRDQNQISQEGSIVSVTSSNAKRLSKVGMSDTTSGTTGLGSGRVRGASIGSITTSESTRLSTPPQGSVITRSVHPDESGSAASGSGSERAFDLRSGLGIHSLRPLTIAAKEQQGNSVTIGSEPTGVDANLPSIMSVAVGTINGDQSKSATLEEQPPVALDDNQALSLPSPTVSAGGGEDSAPSGSPSLSRSGTGLSSSFRPLYRKVSSHAEAKDIISQNERDIIELAQLPMSADSSRSLSAHLAAFAENHAIEQELARLERRKSIRSESKKSLASHRSSRMTGTNTSASASAGIGSDGRNVEFSKDVDGLSGSDSASYFSANSNLTTFSSRRSSDISRASKSVHSVQPRSTSSPMYTIDAPKSSVNSINSIYDRRATAYRERLTALTTAPPVLKPRRQSVGLPPVIRHEYVNPILQPSSLSTTPKPAEIEVDLHPNISSPLPVVSTPLIQNSPRKGRGSATAGTRRSASSPSRRSSAAAAKAAQVYSTAASPRRQVDSDSLNVRKTRVTSPTAASGHPSSSSNFTTDLAIYSPSRHHRHHKSTTTSASGNAQPGSLTYSPGLRSGSAISSMSNSHLALKQGDGDDSDDPDSETRQYTMIQNDWRGGFVVGSPMSPPGSGVIGAAQQGDADTFRRGFGTGNGRWGGIRGAIGHLGRK